MIAFAISTTLTGPLSPVAPPLLTILIGLIRRFPRPDIFVMTAASVLGVVWALGTEAPGGPAHLRPGEPVALEGWLEVELDGGDLLHASGDVVPLHRPPGSPRSESRSSDEPRPSEGLPGGRPGDTSAVDGEAEWTSGRAVRVWGVVAEPWHPAARPSVRVDSMSRWRSSGVDAPGQPPLTRRWNHLRLAARDRIRDRIRSLFPERAGLVAALVLADRSALPRDLRERFTRAGTAHLLAISGFHVGVLAGWVYLFLGAARVPRARRPLAASAVVWGYVAVLGFPVSAVRAAVLVTAVSIGRLRGRPTHTLGAWGAALAFVALADPGGLGGAGAQLSFAGSLGLILWARPWGAWLGGPRLSPGASRRARWRRTIGVAVAASAAAQVATLGLVAWHFQRIPVAGLPASVLATPPIAVALPGILLSVIAASLPGLPAFVPKVAAAGVDGLLASTIGVVDVLGRMGGEVYVGPTLLVAPGIGAIAGWVLGNSSTRRRMALSDTWRSRARERAGRRARGAVVGAWVGLSVLPAAAGMVSRPLDIHVLDVGQGDAIAIRSPRGRWTLVDAGPGGGDDLLRGLARLGVRRIETLVITHPDLDHVGGAAALVDAMDVGRIAGPGLLRGTEALEALALAAAERGVPWRVVSRGDRWEVDGLVFNVIHAGDPPAEPNDQSVVLHLDHGDFEAILTGDISSAVEDRLSSRLGPSARGRLELLKVAHHGSRTSSSAETLDALAPTAAVISVGRRNRFGHPAPSVLERFIARDIHVGRTDTDGSIRIRARVDGSFRITSDFGTVSDFGGEPAPATRAAGRSGPHAPGAIDVPRRVR